MPSMKSLGDRLAFRRGMPVARPRNPAELVTPGVRGEMDRRLAEMDSGEEGELDWERLHHQMAVKRYIPI